MNTARVIRESGAGVFHGLYRVGCSKRLWINYGVIPLGTIFMLAVSYGVNLLLQLKPVEFPSSVMVLAVLFIAVMLAERIFGTETTDFFMLYFGIPGKFLLKWLAICFCTPFITLPLADHVTVAQAFSMGLIFIIGLVFYWGVCAYMALGVGWVVDSVKKKKKKLMDEEKDEKMDDTEGEILELALSVLEEEKPDLEKIDNTTIYGKSSNFVYDNFDDIFYFVLFWCGLIVYYVRGYGMIMDTAMVAFVFRQVCKLPANYKQYLSPVIVTGAICMLIILITSLIGNNHKPSDFMHDLQLFKTGRNYLFLVNNYRHWNEVNHNDMYHHLPGAGDIYSSFMDAGIIALLVPLYEYRAELIEHCVMLIVPVVSGAIHFFCYPAICYRLFLTSEQSLGFAARSATLALATPVTEGLGGNLQVTAVTGVLSGIVGVLIGDFLLEKVYRVSLDNFMVVGITYGTNSSAVAATALLASDRRTGAIASLSFVLFGVTLVVLTAIPPVAEVVRHLAGE